jgi:deoxyribodipyrimidine photo-lyase
MEEMMYEFRLGEQYPMPIVQLEETRRKSEKLWSLRKTSKAKEEGEVILQRFVRPKKTIDN